MPAQTGNGAGPRPYKQRRARTIFLRVPYSEWGSVKAGRKREFRASPNATPQFWDVEPPMPVVAYAISRQLGYRAQLMVLEEHWREPLGAISPESLAAEGQPDIAHFRRYWMHREHTAFKPTRMVSVFRVRPWQPSDDAGMAERLLERLYGEFLGDVRAG